MVYCPLDISLDPGDAVSVRDRVEHGLTGCTLHFGDGCRVFLSATDETHLLAQLIGRARASRIGGFDGAQLTVVGRMQASGNVVPFDDRPGAA